MHDLIFVFAFIAMVATPAMVAAVGGRKEYNPDPESDSSFPNRREKPFEADRTVPPALPRTFSTNKPRVTTEIRTLPIHHARGLANR
jgi:hypothetical protein